MSIVATRIDYIHAERFGAPPPGSQLQMNINITIEGERSVKRGEVLELPFTASISSTPNVVTVTVRGVAVLHGDVDLKNPPPHVHEPITQIALFEVALILRELGFPPPLPLQSRPQSTPRYI